MYYLGFDIGGTKCASILASCENNDISFISRKQINTTGSWQNILESLCNNAIGQCNDANISTQTVVACGISCGGPLNKEEGIIMSPPNLLGWDNVPVCKFVYNKLGIITKLNNDADACALAEWRFGAGQNCKNMIFLTFGTGMGAGLILGGKLYTGTNGLAGEVGHIRLAKSGPVGYYKAGSFEGFCSGGGIAKLGKKIARIKIKKGENASFLNNCIKDITAKDIAEAARNGNADALEIFKICGQHLGKGLAILIDLLNPQKIIIGSIFARSESLLRNNMMLELKKEALASSLSVCEILPAALDEKIGDYASIVTAME